MSARGDGPESPGSVGRTHAQRVRLFSEDDPLTLEAGGTLNAVDVEYETYGELNAARDNAVLVLHALSGDAHAAGWDADAETTGRRFRANAPGWWDPVIGPGKPIDTTRFFVICSNFLGSCYGTTGPASINPATQQRWGLEFPVVTVGDWVQVQAKLLDHLGVDTLHMALGGSLGGQQAMEWALQQPERVKRCVILAAAARLSAQGLAFNAVGREAIVADPAFQNGNYYEGGEPQQGLGVARMMAHITYLSEEGMHEKFGRRSRGNKLAGDFTFGHEFEVESYLAHQAKVFVERFDANSYLYITRAMDYYDAAQRWGDGDMVEACRHIKSKVMVVSFSSDWLYLPHHGLEFAQAMCRAGGTATYVNVPSQYGHDAFLVETQQVGRLLRSALEWSAA